MNSGLDAQRVGDLGRQVGSQAGRLVPGLPVQGLVGGHADPQQAGLLDGSP